MRIRRCIRLLLVLLAAGFCATAARAEGRMALVIGNSAYAHLPVLDSPRNDAMAVAETLERLGYRVITGIDLDHAATEAKLQQFWQATEDADIALFYYAGHGLQVSGRDYLVPIDAALTDVKDLDRAAFELRGVAAPLEYGPDIGIVFFDASRDDPLPPTVEAPSGDSAVVETPPAGRIVIAFATGPGRAAIHGRGDAHSPFTAALLKQMGKPGLSVEDLLSQVQSTVLESTRGGELPWYTSTYLLGRDIYLAGP